MNDCHYPLRKSPHCYALTRASDQWLSDVAQLVEPEIRGYLDMNTGTLAALCYPDGDAFHLQVCREHIDWAFIIDDWMECGVVDVQEAHESCILALRDPINFDPEQVGAKMCKSFSNRFMEAAGHGCRERYIHANELFFAAVAKQLDDRAKGNTYDLQYYISLRRDLIGLKPCFALIEFVAGIDLPDEVVSHPVFKAMENAANDHISWVNVILAINIVAVLMHDRGLDLQGAMDCAGQMCKDAIQRFESNRDILPSWGEEVDKQVAIYVEGLQNWIVGSLHWHLSCPRYSVAPDRIVKLLPKRPL
ncbi:isoprenoid synthase domain-containing protein [Suillus subluteus]|nr:isoprenoid synthase domain-containing protein [Suillus subluteus]